MSGCFVNARHDVPGVFFVGPTCIAQAASAPENTDTVRKNASPPIK